MVSMVRCISDIILLCVHEELWEMFVLFSTNLQQDKFVLQQA